MTNLNDELHQILDKKPTPKTDQKQQQTEAKIESNNSFFFQEGIDFIEGFSDRFSKPLADAAKTRTIQKAVAFLGSESATTTKTLNELFDAIDVTIEGINESLEEGDINLFLSLPSPLPQLAEYHGNIKS